MFEILQIYVKRLKSNYQLIGMSQKYNVFCNFFSTYEAEIPASKQMKKYCCYIQCKQKDLNKNYLYSVRFKLILPFLQRHTHNPYTNFFIYLKKYHQMFCTEEFPYFSKRKFNFRIIILNIGIMRIKNTSNYDTYFTRIIYWSTSAALLLGLIVSALWVRR